MIIEEKIIRKLNRLRRLTLCKSVVFYVFFPIISYILYFFTTLISHHYLFLIITLLYIIFLNFVFFMVFKPDFQKQFIKEYKIALIEKIKTYLHETISFDSIGLKEEEILKGQMLPFITKFKSFHLIKISSDNIELKSSDIQFYYYHHKNEQTTFRGQWYVIHFDQSFKSTIHLYEKDSNFYKIYKPIELSRYKTDDYQFNHNFIIYTNHQDKTSRLLNSHLRERINLFKRKYGSKLIFIFHQNSLHIGIHHHHFRFKPSLFDKINQIKFMALIEDFILIKNIIKYIKTYNKLSYINYNHRKNIVS